MMYRLCALVAILCYVSSAAAHMCILEPVTQRGGFEDGPIEKGDRRCVLPSGPCGGLDAEKPQLQAEPGVAVPFLVMQNLNHFSIGSKGTFDVSYSTNLTATEDEYTLIQTWNDYQTYHEWTTTNRTVDVVMPDFVSDHMVLMFRYKPNKPTEPDAFHQCVDIAINNNNNGGLIRQLKPVTVAAAVATPVVPVVNHVTVDNVDYVGLMDTSDQSTDSLAQMFAFDVDSNAASYVVDLPYAVDSDAEISVQDSVGAKDFNSGNVYYMQRTANDFTSFTLLEYSPAESTGTINTYSIGPETFPTSQFHITGDATFVSVGFQAPEDSNGDYGLTLSTWDLSTTTPQQVGAVWPAGPYVDLAWSQYAHGNVYTLLRHEDEPTALYAKLVVLSLNDNSVVSVSQLDTDYIFSSFFVDARDSVPVLYAMSPGAVDDNGDALTPTWQLISVDLATNVSTSVVTLQGQNIDYPVFWSGGVFGFDMDHDTTGYFNIAHDINVQKTDGKEVPLYVTPVVIEFAHSPPKLTAASVIENSFNNIQY